MPDIPDDFFDRIVDPIFGRPMYFDKQGNPISLRQWGELREPPSEYFRIGEDQVGTAWVSTVWLGMDHGFWGRDEPGYKPVIFETMIFGDYFVNGEMIDDACMRYCTEEEAIDGHRRTVEDVRAGRTPWFLVEEDATNGNGKEI